MRSLSSDLVLMLFQFDQEKNGRKAKASLVLLRYQRRGDENKGVER